MRRLNGTAAVITPIKRIVILLQVKSLITVMEKLAQSVYLTKNIRNSIWRKSRSIWLTEVIDFGNSLIKVHK